MVNNMCELSKEAGKLLIGVMEAVGDVNKDDKPLAEELTAIIVAGEQPDKYVFETGMANKFAMWLFIKEYKRFIDEACEDKSELPIVHEIMNCMTQN